MKYHHKILIAVAFQIGLVLLIPFYKNTQKEDSAVIFLNAAPVDPLDPMRGHYLRFTYPTLNPIYDFEVYPQNPQYESAVPTIRPRFEVGETLYVHTSPDNQDYARVRTEQPTENKTSYIQGVIIRKANNGSDNGYEMNYGIEDYFIPEDKVPKGPIPQGQWKAKIRIDQHSVGSLEQMYLDNTPWP